MLNVGGSWMILENAWSSNFRTCWKVSPMICTMLGLSKRACDQGLRRASWSIAGSSSMVVTSVADLAARTALVPSVAPCGLLI